MTNRPSIFSRQLQCIQLEDILQRDPLFLGLDSEKISAVAALLRKRTVHDGEPIFFEGDQSCKSIFFCTQGSIELLQGDHVIHTCYSGESFGVESMLEDKPQKYSAIGKRNATVWEFRREDLYAHAKPESLLRRAKMGLYFSRISSKDLAHTVECDACVAKNCRIVELENMLKSKVVENSVLERRLRGARKEREKLETDMRKMQEDTKSLVADEDEIASSHLSDGFSNIKKEIQELYYDGSDTLISPALAQKLARIVEMTDALLVAVREEVRRSGRSTGANSIARPSDDSATQDDLHCALSIFALSDTLRRAHETQAIVAANLSSALADFSKLHFNLTAIRYNTRPLFDANILPPWSVGATFGTPYGLERSINVLETPKDPVSCPPPLLLASPNLLHPSHVSHKNYHDNLNLEELRRAHAKMHQIDREFQSIAQIDKEFKDAARLAVILNR